ncbi:MAG: hypothetical protein ACR2JC_18825 [Chloroflexota bacterium]|nr:MAG: hypothetical protein DLM70_03425 [Chloroflexota bacterium]
MRAPLLGRDTRTDRREGSIRHEEQSRDRLFRSEGGLYSPKLADAIEHIAAGMLVIRREMDEPGVVAVADSLNDVYLQFDRDASFYSLDDPWMHHGLFLTSLLCEMRADAVALEAQALHAKATLEQPF